MIHVNHITLSCHLTGRHTGSFSMTKAIHPRMLNKGHTHMIQITVVGIENCSVRSYGYASAMKKLLSSKVELMNRNFCYFICYLWQLQDLNWTNIVYMFDEAFPTDLVLYWYHLFMESTTTKYFISFKAGNTIQAINTY